MVCGYCGNAGYEYYDSNGGVPSSISWTVHWRCTGYVGLADTVDDTQSTRAEFALRRASNLIRNQPALTRLLSAAGGAMSGQVTQGNGQFSATTPGDAPVWGHIAASRSSAGSTDDSYLLGAVGAHAFVTPDLIVGGMVQFDRARTDDGTAEVKGSGWLVGPYMVARLADQPLYFEASLLAGNSSNDISPDGTYTDNFSASRALASLKLTGEIARPGGLMLYPNVAFHHALERQRGYVDGLGQTIPKQTVKLNELSYGLDFALPLKVESGTLTLTGGLSGIYADVNADAASALIDGYDGHRAMLRVGLDRGFAGGAALSFGAFYDGIGVSDYDSWGLDLSYSARF